MMNLREGDFLLDTVLKFPTLYSPFERPSNRIGHARLTIRRVVLLLEPIEEGVGLEPSILLEW